MNPSPPSPWPASANPPPQDALDAARLVVPASLHDEGYQRPIRSRYVDPLEVIWLATARRLGLTVRRDPDIFSMTDGTGLMAFSTRAELDADDCLAQMTLHELCHWVTNGVDSYHQRDWGFALWDQIDVREHACLRLQCWLATRWGLRDTFGPTSGFRQYYDALPADPLQPLDDSEWEQVSTRIARQAVARVQGDPWWGPLSQAMQATADLQAVLRPFLPDYHSEVEGDPLPVWWTPAPGA
ncbi:hypothetical protein L6R53_22425 [Myxococcota bacterium]|nr:hypothetical protein [Myxococcota bacterium]